MLNRAEIYNAITFCLKFNMKIEPSWFFSFFHVAFSHATYTTLFLFILTAIITMMYRCTMSTNLNSITERSTEYRLNTHAKHDIYRHAFLF